MRIIAGRFKGRKLMAPAKGVRPTTDRVKERLFSVLGPFTGDERVVDLFCGSGALGIEARRRGARSAVFIDSAAESLRILERNLEPLRDGPEEIGVVARRCDAPGFIRRSWPAHPVHICFLDPPYGAAAGGACLRELGRLPEGRVDLIVFEGPDVDLDLPAGLAETRRLVCGETRITLLTRGDRT